MTRQMALLTTLRQPMAPIESLPPDQRAVLQMVLQRGRSYDQIAELLGIDRAAVRQRALDAFDELGPSTSVSDIERGLVTDYLLGQLPTKVADQVRARLGSSPPQRAWARVVASEISAIAENPLPEIPAASSRRRPEPAPEPAAAEVPDRRDELSVWERTAADAAEPSVRTPEAREPATAAHAEAAGEHGDERPSSRRGGAILLGGLVAIIIVAVVVVILVSGNSGKSGNTTAPNAGSTASSSTVSGTGTGTSTTGTSTSAQLLKQLNLLAPDGSKKVAAVVQVAREGTTTGIVIIASGLAANTTHNAYGVWLWNTTSDHGKFLGFYSKRVTSNGRLEAAEALPSDATSYNEMLITLETAQKPTKPGQVVLQGKFDE